MSETLSVYPAAFWAVLALLVSGGVWAGFSIRQGIGLPILAVLGTVTAWYIGDVFYNDYANFHVTMFDPGVLDSAWWQVAWFLVVFLFASPILNQKINANLLSRESGVLKIVKDGVQNPTFQRQINRLFQGCFVLWAILTIIAVIRLKGEIWNYFFPFGTYAATPWGRGRVGTGFDSLLALALYFDELVSGAFGVVLASSTNRRIRGFALACCIIAWPHYIVNRTRNTLLAVVIPGLVSWVFLRLRGSMLKKLVILGISFMVVNAWMKFIIANRSQMSITQALHEKGFSFKDQENIRHEGLNMFEELCWINTFMREGTYHPNWGSRYYAEIANVVPRTLWPGKPEIGTDYAIARGQSDGQGGLNATISTGLIGQGVVNFGTILGPAAAALLMAIWVALLSRVDLTFDRVGHILLYPFGLILTFNLGRDITLLTLYPFVFGSLLLWWIDRRTRAQKPAGQQQAPRNVSAIPANTVGGIIESQPLRPSRPKRFALARSFRR